MKTLRSLAMLASAGLVIGASLLACGDDEENPVTPSDEAGADGPLVPPPNPPNPPNPPPPGPDGGDGGAASFPAYVQQLILTKTTENGVPETEAVWGAIPDDEAFVFPATFFP